LKVCGDLRRDHQVVDGRGFGVVLLCSDWSLGNGDDERARGDGDVGFESDPVADDAAYGDEPASATLTQALPQMVNLRLQVILLLDVSRHQDLSERHGSVRHTHAA
jgi:hypothetical protein